MNGFLAASAPRRKCSSASFREYAFWPLYTLLPFDEVRVDRNFHFQHVDLVLRLGKFLHALDHDLRLDLGELEALLVAALRVVAHELAEERDLERFAFRADALDESVLDIVDLRVVERRVVKQNLHRIRAPIGDALSRDVRQQIGQSGPGLRVVVAALFIGQQQACIRGARFRSRESILGIEQDRAGVRRQNFRYRHLELAHHLVGDLIFRRLPSRPRWPFADCHAGPSRRQQ